MSKKLTHKNSDLGGALGFLDDGTYDELVCIPDYDAGKPERTATGRRVIRFSGDATYEVTNRCEYGCAYHCRRIRLRGVEKSRTAYKARAEAILNSR